MAPLAAIVGVGATEIGVGLPRTPLSLAADAVAAAAADAGLERAAIDGLVVTVGSPHGLDYDVVADRLGLELRWALQTWAHGRFVAACVQAAAMAVATGMADVVAVVHAAALSAHAASGASGAEAAREGGGPHGELPHQGLVGPASGAAMATRRYCERYGVDPLALGAVSVSQRAHAALNPRALRREPITLADYAGSPLRIDPLRALDLGVPADGGVCLLVTSPERARDTPDPVFIAGMQGLQAGREEFVFARPGLGVQQQTAAPFAPSERDLAARRQAGVEAADIDAFYVYDTMSPLVWFALERFGFCGEGEAADFCGDGRIGPGGALPVNTHGGMLSEGHLCGFGHLREMVEQLRGAGGERQVPGARVVQWGSCLGDSLVLGAEEI